MNMVVGVIGRTLASAEAYCRERGLPMGLACDVRMVRAGALRNAPAGQMVVLDGLDVVPYVRFLPERFEEVIGA